MKRSPLWAITCLFNPQRYRARIANYQVFRERLAVPLVAVELSFDGAFELRPGDADILVQVTGGDVMWQKERLLNLGRASLPPECEAVATLDADIVFTRRDWHEAALAALRETPVVQLFSRLHHLPPNASPDDGTRGVRESQESWGAAMRDGRGDPRTFREAGVLGRGVWAPGMAWAFDRTLLDRHGLYDGSIVGGGDSAAACAGWGAFDAIETRHSMTERQREYYRAWAEPWFADVRGRIGCIEGDLLHLWHGSIENRGHMDRHRNLAAHAFDPFRDLASHAGGAWRWASDKPELHRHIRDYFAARREDG